ncbi:MULTISPECIES: DUF2075 domain-containing protein [unclassified Streptomyces]|uniref:DUF2075 domain-containing protein n=1 Tax=unclassified Streptomyces TaxID=2593676 RepID=UPI0006AEAAA5|nr:MULTISPECIES: DUF2075 domain-containing protein [unclassified Streptomyces]KOX22477.1 hypothetical protein ADL06_24435 [Streptomyces sp. NRRL F-6491]KOX38758.1 hypothetical protein ADL08_26780 [Streptomyces sp. NRRL F-6492]
MLLLQLSARRLLKLHDRNRLLSHMAARWVRFKGNPASDSEQEAWRESLVRLAEELVDAGHGELHMFVECQPEGVEGAADVILVGVHPETGQDSLLVIELKRWGSVEATENPGKVAVPGFRRPKKHPSAQVGKIVDFFASDDSMNGLSVSYAGLTYLHNATEDSVLPLLAAGTSKGAHSFYFTDDTRLDLLEEVRDRFQQESGAPAAGRLLKRLGLQNAPLLEAMALSEGADTAFTLRGEQRSVWRDVKRAVDRGRSPSGGGSERSVFLVRGGAGTGKSAIGLQLLRHFTAVGLTARYATGSIAFHAALEKLFQRDGILSTGQLAHFLSFVERPVPVLDLLICDEAHRMREVSKLQYWPPERHGKQPQVDELIQAARVTVFLLDENQSLRRGEVGSSQLVVEAAQRHGATPEIYDLHTEFRCGGSEGYRQWVLDLLGISGEVPHVWEWDGLMHVEVADAVEDLERVVREEQRDGATARMVAGFCWPWNEPDEKTRELPLDVKLGEWRRPWNAKGTLSRHANGEPPAALWGVDSEGVGQVGCVYTAQGLEWDWCGVILGDDMVRRGDVWHFKKGKVSGKDEETGLRKLLKPGSVDPGLPSDPDEFARRIRNAYHVLLTRASSATVIYSVDPETQRYLKKMVAPVDEEGLRPTSAALPAEQRFVRKLRAHAAEQNQQRGASGSRQLGLFDS